MPRQAELTAIQIITALVFVGRGAGILPFSYWSFLSGGCVRGNKNIPDVVP